MSGNVKNQIKPLRQALGLTQQEFADKIGLKRNTIASYEIGKNEPMETVVLTILREFNVNENWLRYGEGEIFEDLSEDEEMMDLIGKLSADGNVLKKRALLAAAKIIDNDEVWCIIENQIRQLIDELKEE